MKSLIYLLKRPSWFLLIPCITLISCDGNKRQSLDCQTSTKKVLRISSSDIIQATELYEYWLQSLMADQEKEVQKALIGKKFHIMGRIKVSDKGWKDRLEYVQIKAFQKDTNTVLICHLSNEFDREKLLEVDENTTIVLFGEFVGYSHFPNFKDCRLISVNQ